MRLLAVFFLFLTFAFSQEPSDSDTSDTVTARGFWKANLPGGNYTVALDSITAVSNHSYILDAAVVVTEVTIDTTGTTVVRFYQITPLADYSELNITSLLSDGIDAIGDIQEDYLDIDLTTTVQKKYPLTTHAKTVEYQIKTLPQLRALFQSVSKAWENNRGRSFSIK